jgi:alkylation response protein AidB-like acyl-CoA dehydrogenase
MTLSSAEHPLVATVREFVEREVRPVAAALEHADRYPHDLVARMRELGLFGALIPAAYGGLGLDVTTYARVIEELCRGWMSLAGVLNSHTMAALIVLQHGTGEQQSQFLPRLARGQARGGLCLTEPHAGSDVQAIRTVARRRGDEYVIDGTKMFVTNGREGNTFALLALTNPRAEPRHRGMSCFIVEKGHPGLRVAKSISKLGYKGVDTAELVFEDVAVPAANLVGGVEGRGFRHVMSGLETGRINIAARAVGVGQAAWEAALEHARRAGEAPPALASMAARLDAARLLTSWAAGMKDRRERCDLEAGMAKLWATETAQGLAVETMRLQGETAALATSAVERLYRDTPLMIIGEGTNEIQRTLIARQLLERHGERPGALTSREGEPDERRQMVLAVRQFVEKEVVPVAAEHEQAGRYPADVVRALGDLGIFGAVVPPPYGGLGLDLGTYAMIIEELARGWTTVAGIVTAHATAAWTVAGWGTSEQRQRLLPAMTRGEILGAAALAEGVTARRDRTDCVLAGATGLVDNAPRAQLFVALGRIDDGRRVLVLLPRGTPGLALGTPEPTLGSRGLDPARLWLDGARVAAAAVLEGEDGGEAPVAAALGVARLGLAATAVGLAQAAFEAALRYSQQRSAFGKPICQHQAIQLKLADMATAITAARLLTSHAAGRLEAGDDVPAGLARLYAAEAAYEVTLEAMRIHGGYGYTTEFPIERYYRDAPRLMLALAGAQRERAELARRLLGS